MMARTLLLAFLAAPVISIPWTTPYTKGRDPYTPFTDEEGRGIFAASQTSTCTGRVQWAEMDVDFSAPKSLKLGADDDCDAFLVTLMESWCPPCQRLMHQILKLKNMAGLEKVCIRALLYEKDAPAEDLWTQVPQELESLIPSVQLYRIQYGNCDHWCTGSNYNPGAHKDDIYIFDKKGELFSFHPYNDNLVFDGSNMEEWAVVKASKKAVNCTCPEGGEEVAEGCKIERDPDDSTIIAGFGVNASYFEHLTPKVIKEEDNPPQKSYGIAITDFDDDGLFDIFIVGYGNSNLAFSYNTTTKHLERVDIDLGLDDKNDNRKPFDSESEPPVNGGYSSSIGVAACDMDGDGVEEIYVLNTDTYGGDKEWGDTLFTKKSGKYIAQEIEPLYAGRSVVCVDRIGKGKYDVAAATYAKDVLMYSMDSETKEITSISESVGYTGVTGGRAMTAGPIVPGHSYTDKAGMDIFMNNEAGYGSQGCNFLFESQGDGTYKEVAEKVGLTDCDRNGRGVSLIDFDKDGLLDILYGNWNDASRIWLQVDPSLVTDDTGNGTGNGTGSFRDAVPDVPDLLNRKDATRNIVVADLDNDGFPELFLNNIDSYNRGNQTNRVYRYNTDSEIWYEANVGAAAEPYGHGTGAAVVDYDGDGILELVLSHGESAEQRVTVYKASPALTRDNHYIRVYVTTANGAPARGALVQLLESNSHKPQMRIIDPGSGYLCQSEPVAHFGLGRNFRDVDIKVTFIDGCIVTEELVATDQTITIQAPGSCKERLEVADKALKRAGAGQLVVPAFILAALSIFQLF